MKMVCYVRVSTAQQAQEGYSLAAQQAALAAWCAAMGHQCVRVAVDEGVSARSLDRPALSSALEHVFAPNMHVAAHGLVVLKLDRLTRSLGDLCQLLRRFEQGGKVLASVRDSLDTSSPAGRLLVHVLGSFAQFESEIISERTKAGMAEAKRQGKHVGRPVKVYDPELVAQVAAALERSTLVGAARRLMRDRPGERWNADKVKRVLRGV